MRADEETPWDAGGRFLLVAIAVLLIARIPLIPVRFFDPDEFEHSHAAWSVFRGLLPYKDFFEHHTPWYYYGLSPFFRWFAVDQSFENARHFLIFARGAVARADRASVAGSFWSDAWGPIARWGSSRGCFSWGSRW